MNIKLQKAVGVLQLIAGALAAIALIQNIIRGGEIKMVIISAVVMVSGLFLGYENFWKQE